MSITIREFLAENTLTREVVDRFLDPDANNWATFDPDLGFVRKNSIVRDGLGWCYTRCTYRPTGERTTVNYAGRNCRINSYGDSFTHCDQVSDGETWQEYLAAHLGEPIRNFGVGSYGFYQAYRRMLKEEQTESSAKYIILNIFDEDHCRSLYQWRALHMKPHFWPGVRESVASPDVFLFHGNPWAYLRLNPDTGQFEERENEWSTPDSLYQLCDQEYVYETFKDNFDIQVFLAQQLAADVDFKMLARHAEALEVPPEFSTPAESARTAEVLLNTCALDASISVLDKARAFASQEGKQLMILLTYSIPTVIAGCEGRDRFDQKIVDYLIENEFLFVDMLGKHVEDFQAFRCTPEEYVKRYYVGHYGPLGNHFLAFSLKDAMRRWLDPEPPAYNGF